ncbi:type VI secretion system contractile sheath small subunit [Flavobacterium jejuense]|uniref:Type VI secretion system contractile sheath small subunit n=1 Tax=Flavobacterium jejuense TaxID=1544455 RepID=A0ABX0IW54_9FLAO|nr:type VI secretion system contractile sheath small subunit [Flavobacterium jejuense]NHN28052.1 type VI secretion system contractile sheath small subunit [Flavobacterium jejuense]
MAERFSGSYGIGGNEVRVEGQEGILEIPQNRTLIAQKLTPNTPVKPEIVSGLKNMDEVFEHFNPKVKMAFEDENGQISREELQFKNVGDFSINGIVEQSSYLSDLRTKNEQYQKLIKQLKTNKVLKLALQDPEAKKSIIESLETLISEIEASDK